MCHSTGKVADRFHFLCLDKLFLQTFPLSNVFLYTNKMSNHSLCILDW
ncbi:hypothetical protein ES708_20653 [subsurface metagenome]